MTASEFKTIRERAGLTQMQAAVKLDVTIATVSRWENGHVPISPPRSLWIKSRIGLSARPSCCHTPGT